MTALINTTEEALSGGEMTTFTTNHQPKSKIFMMTLEDLAEVALYNISNWGCSLCWMSLDVVPICGPFY